MSRGLSQLQRYLLGCLVVRPRAVHTTMSLKDQAQIPGRMTPSRESVYRALQGLEKRGLAERGYANRTGNGPHAWSTAWQASADALLERWKGSDSSNLSGAVALDPASQSRGSA